MIYAQNTGLIDAVPSVNIWKAFEKPQKKNMPVSPDQLPQLMQTTRTASINRSTPCLFMWQLLTITRPAEAAQARWDENLSSSKWKILAARMKMNRGPYGSIIRWGSCYSGNDEAPHGGRELILLSHIKPNQPMNSQTVNAALKRAG
ncbi:tyrosine-type recombinase/integrase [Escherichia coli]